MLVLGVECFPGFGVSKIIEGKIMGKENGSMSFAIAGSLVREQSKNAV